MESEISLRLLSSLVPLCLWAFLDSADASYFGGIFRVLEVDLHLNMSDMARLQGSLCLAVMLCVPAWGTVIDKKLLGRRTLLVISSAGWGFATIAIAMCAHTWKQFLILRFINTAFLCSGLPIAQSVITSRAHPRIRGACFGATAVAGATGTILSSKLSTSISEELIFGIVGWRFGLLVIGLLSLAFSVLVLCFMSEPPCESAEAVKEASTPGGVVAAVIGSFKDNWASLSFRILVAQCASYQICVQALPFVAMWLQYSGYSDSQTGTVIAIWRLGGMFGQVVGGIVGDLLYSFSPMHGRQILGQGSTLLVIPVVTVMFALGTDFPTTLMVLMFTFGVLETAWGTGVNRPIMSMVASRGQVASMISWKLALENAFGLLVGPALITRLAAGHGYESSQLKVSEMPAALRDQNAEALQSVMLEVTTGSYLAMFLVYTILHVAFQLDLERIGSTRTGDAASEESEPLKARANNLKLYSGA